MTSLQNISIIKVSLCLLAFSTGLGIEFPWVNLAGNLSVFDVFLCIFVFIFTRSLKLTHLSAFPVMIGIIGLCSIGYNSLFTYSYHQVGFVAIPIAFRWMYFGFLLRPGSLLWASLLGPPTQWKSVRNPYFGDPHNGNP